MSDSDNLERDARIEDEARSERALDRLSASHRSQQADDHLDRQVRLLGAAKVSLIVALVAYFMLSSIVNVWTLTETLDQSKSNGIIVKRLQDCSTPTGECYQRSQTRTSTAIEDINRFTIAAAWCARALPRTATEQQYRECVTTRVAIRPPR